MLGIFQTDSPASEDAERLLPQSDSEKVLRQTGSIGFRIPLYASLQRMSLRWLSILRPSFLATRTPSSSKAPPPGGDKPELSAAGRNSTEYLDGVRGVASVIVLFLHWFHYSWPITNEGWGYKDNSSFWLLPFVRLIYSGAAMVAVFFVVSGFVLSHRFVLRMHRAEHDAIFSSLSSITFRRALRLYLPSFVSTVLAYICASVGLMEVPDKVSGKPFQHGLPAYWAYLDKESNPWTWEIDTNDAFYNGQFWSIAVEFRGSMVVFLMIAGLARTRTAVRLAVECFLVCHCFAHQRWDVALFIAGVVIAELRVLVKGTNNRRRQRTINALLYAVLFLGVFLSGYPRDHPTETPGYMWTKHVWPYTSYRRRFWLGISSILIVGPMAFLPPVQSLFLTRPARYLGRISFALYLIHGLGNRIFGRPLLNMIWQYTGKTGDWFTVAVMLTTVIYFPVLFWAADLFWRGVDVPSTHFAKWLENKCMAR